MKAPEKIYVYIPDDDIVGTASIQKGFPHQFVTEEYTRTDAFIEKVENYLKEQFIEDVSVLGSGTVHIKFNTAIENFLKYMKG